METYSTQSTAIAVGTTVKVNDPEWDRHGEVGTVVRVDPDDWYRNVGTVDRPLIAVALASYSGWFSLDPSTLEVV